jgi:hypothetical protein
MPIIKKVGDGFVQKTSNEMNKFGWYLERRNMNITHNTKVLTMLNKFRIPDYNDVFEGSKHHIFITRPDLQLFDANGLLPGVKRIPYMSDLYDDRMYGRHILEQLQQSGSKLESNFIPSLGNVCKGYTPVDDEIDAVERGETKHGHKIVYAKHNFKTRSAGTVSLPFMDNRNLMVYKTIKAWVDYIEHVSIGLTKPRREYILKPRLDYASSLYYVVTKPDMTEIIYWEKLVGLFPINIPNSAFAFQEGQSIVPEYNISFRYSMKDRSMNPYILRELNMLAKRITSMDDFGAANWDTANNMYGDTWSNSPIVSSANGKYYLTWS